MKTKILIPVLFLLSLYGCAYVKPSSPPPQMSELERLRADFPVFPGTTKIPNDFRVAAPNTAALNLNFKSNTDFGDVETFYKERLKAEGWQLIKESQMSEWGRDLGGRELQFQKGEYEISIEKAGSNNKDWDFAVGFSWKKNSAKSSNLE